jgi:hypothetical protein
MYTIIVSAFGVGSIAVLLAGGMMASYCAFTKAVKEF